MPGRAASRPIEEGQKRQEICDRARIVMPENVPHVRLYSADTIDFTPARVKGERA